MKLHRLIFSVFAALCAMSLLAQGRGGPRMTPEERTAAITKDLGLNAKQQKQIKAILEGLVVKMKDIAATVPGEDRPAARANANKDAAAQVSKILTPAQLEKARYHGSVLEMISGPPGGEPITQLYNALNCTLLQRSQIDAIMVDYNKVRGELTANSHIPLVGPGSRNELLRQNSTKHHTMIMHVLTAEQGKKFEAMQAEASGPKYGGHPAGG